MIAIVIVFVELLSITGIRNKSRPTIVFESEILPVERALYVIMFPYNKKGVASISCFCSIYQEVRK